MTDIIKKLETACDASDEELKGLIGSASCDTALYEAADRVRRANYGTDVYMRGLIEFTSYCKNDCFYCGLRRSNRSAVRYRLEKSDILECARAGYALGFRTFVLQGGEDMHYTDDMICDIVSALKAEFPECAVTLSIGEKSRESYQKYFDAGADRYLLRHESADNAHYSKLHPASLSPENRKRCLYDLKEIGYQVGAGFMTGSPYQTVNELISDLRFMQKLRPDMIGIGPFIPHNATPFRDMPAGTLDLTLRMLAITRLMFPYALIPATTALGTISPDGRERGLRAGANVIMPNLSPAEVRKYYELYNNKLHSGEEAAEAVLIMGRRIRDCGYTPVVARGDVRRGGGEPPLAPRGVS